MALKPSTMRMLREWHLYLGMLFAPMLLLFTVSGAFQTFRIPDRPGAPAWIKVIAAVHKDQGPPHERKRPPMAPGAEGAKPGDPAAKGDAPKPAKHNKLPLQIFVVLLSWALLFSTISGMIIALNSRATRRTSIIMLVIGTVLPILLFYL